MPDDNVTMEEALRLLKRASTHHHKTAEDLSPIKAAVRWWQISEDLYQWRTKLQAWLKQ